MIEKLSKKILSLGYICDNCLGRQFAQLLTGMSNKERGKIIRTLFAFENEIKSTDIDFSNIQKYRFRINKPKKIENKKCFVCNDLFKKLDEFANKAIKKLENIEFNSFYVSNKIDPDLIIKEENLWENIGIKYCEPIKAEINREFGKILEKKMKKNVSEKEPDVIVLLNLEKNKVELKINPIFIYGGYKKFVRNIPQTRLSGYKESIEQLIGETIKIKSNGSGYILHGAGREDIDVKCFDFRPFVIEILEPKKRKINLKEIENEINKNKKISVKGLRFSSRKEIVKVKSIKIDKTYEAIIESDKNIEKINRLKQLIGIINQKTPKRVLPRRADIIRKRNVKDINWKLINNKTIKVEIKAESGLYIKELITGDDGRTKPNISEILNSNIKIKELNVKKFWL